MFERHRPTWVEVRLDNLYHNWRIMNDHVEPKTVIPVVKGDAYSHGLTAVVRHFRKQGVGVFATSLLEEALEAKRAAPDAEVLVMGAVLPGDFDRLAESGVMFTVSTAALFQEALDHPGPLRIHLKADTGMHRRGFVDEEEIARIAKTAQEAKNIHLEGIYTHFATADDNEEYLFAQTEKFERMLERIEKRPPMVHVSNTSAIMKYERRIPYTTHARMGIGLYGTSLEDGDCGFDLRETFTLKSKIIEIKELKKGDRISYNLTYEAKGDERIGVLPIGYADGFIRKNQGGEVVIGDDRYPIVGRICMDHTFVRVDRHVHVGDTAVLIGGGIHVDEVAERTGTINYEVFCQVSGRVPRIFIGEDDET